MAKITLEINEIVNGVTITESPIELTSEGLLASAASAASNVTFTPTGNIAATDVQAAIAELETDRATERTASNVTFTPVGDLDSITVQAALSELDTEKLSLAGGTMTGTVKFTDSQRIQLGDGFDFQMYHDGSNSYLRDFGVGDLIIQATNLQMLNAAGESYIQCTSDGSVALYYDNVSRANTSSLGLNVNGTLTATNVDASGLIEFNSLRGTGIAAVTTILDEDDMSSNSDTALSTQQSIKAYVDSQVAGKDNTDEITEGSTNLYFTNARADARIAAADTGDLSEGSNLYFTNARADARIAADSSLVRLTDTQTLTNKTLTSPDVNTPDIDGGTIDGTVIGGTTPAAGSFTTISATDNVSLGTNDKLLIGSDASTRLEIYHNGTNAYIQKLGSNTLRVPCNIFSVRNAADSKNLIRGVDGGAAELYHDGQKKLESTDTGTLTTGAHVSTVKVGIGEKDYGDGNGTVPLVPTKPFHVYHAETDVTARLESGDIGAGLELVDNTTTAVVRADDGVLKISSDFHNAASGSHIELHVDGSQVAELTSTGLNSTVIGDTTAAAGNFTSLTATGQVTINAATPSLVWNDTDGNERTSIFHAGGVAYYTSIDSDETFGTHRFRRDTQSGDPINIFETFADGDVRFYKANGTDALFDIDAVNNSVEVTGDLKVAAAGASTSTVIKTNTTQSASTWDYTGKDLLVGSSVTGDGNPTGIWLGNSGTSLYTVGTSQDDIDQFTLSSAYDISTASLTRTFAGSFGGNPQAIVFSDNGARLWVLDGGSDQIKEFALSTPFDISTTGSVLNFRDFTDNVDTNPTGFRFNNDGTKLIICGTGGKVVVNSVTATDYIASYDLSTPYDISTIGVSSGTNAVAPDTTINFSDFTDSSTADKLSDAISLPNGIEFADSGNTLHVLCKDREGVVSFRLATAYDISSTMTVEGFANFNGLDTNPTDLYVDYTNDIAIVIGQSNDYVRQYSVKNESIKIEAPGSVQVTNNFVAEGKGHFERGLSVGGRVRTYGALTVPNLTATGNVSLSPGSSGTINIGSTTQTGLIQVGRSTDTNTLDIQNGVTESGKTATVNLGTSGASGSTTNINIGGGSGTCVVKLANLPTHADEAAATSAGLAQNTVYKTSTGELRIKL